MDAPWKIRPARPEDEPGLRTLWRRVFADDDAFLDAFFRRLFRPALTLTAWGGPKLCGALYLLDCAELVTAEETRVPCRMTYAFCTASDMRGRGLGRALVRRSVELGWEVCGAVNVLHPATPELFRFYANAIGARPVFYIREQTWERRPYSGGTRVYPADPASYRELRERLLRGRAHLALNEDALTFAAETGSALLQLETAHGPGCAFADREAETLQVRELLLPAFLPEAAYADAASAILHTLDGGRLTARMPGAAADVPFGVLSVPEGELVPDCGSDAWFGPAFD